MQVRRSNDEIFSVYYEQNQEIVDLKDRTCTCNKFQLDQLPCEHTLAVLKELNQEPYTYSSHYYTTETMVATYEATVYPLPSQTTWCIPNDVKEMVVLPPRARIRAGRPKKTRAKSPWEMKTENKCGRCGLFGHNRKTCRNPPNIQ